MNGSWCFMHAIIYPHLLCLVFDHKNPRHVKEEWLADGERLSRYLIILKALILELELDPLSVWPRRTLEWLSRALEFRESVSRLSDLWNLKYERFIRVAAVLKSRPALHVCHLIRQGIEFIYTYDNYNQLYTIYMIPVRGSLPPPPPPHGMVPKPAFCSIPHENVVFAVFFAWWVAGAVRNPANSLDFCNQPSENVLFAMFRLRHRGVVSPRPLLFLCQIII